MGGWGGNKKTTACTPVTAFLPVCPVTKRRQTSAEVRRNIVSASAAHTHKIPHWATQQSLGNSMMTLREGDREGEREVGL